MSSKDHPAVDRTTEKPAEKPEPKKAARPNLMKAGASGDAGVQNLLARRGCTEDAEQIAAIDAELADLGYAI